MSKFPNLIAAVEAREKRLKEAKGADMWAIGAAIVKDCYGGVAPNLSDNERGTSTAKLEEAAVELAKRGFKEYSVRHLNMVARTACLYPPSRRHKNLSFTSHVEAGNPDLLDWVVDQAGDDVSSRDVREWVARWIELQNMKQREKIDAAKRDKATAKTLDDRRRADAKLKKLSAPMPTPKSEMSAPSKRDQGELARSMGYLKIDSDALKIVNTLRDNLATLREGEVGQEYIGALVEHHALIIEVASQIVDLLGGSKGRKFTVHKGGAA